MYALDPWKHQHRSKPCSSEATEFRKWIFQSDSSENVGSHQGATEKPPGADEDSRSLWASSEFFGIVLTCFEAVGTSQWASSLTCNGWDWEKAVENSGFAKHFREKRKTHTSSFIWNQSPIEYNSSWYWQQHNYIEPLPNTQGQPPNQLAGTM